MLGLKLLAGKHDLGGPYFSRQLRIPSGIRLTAPFIGHTLARMSIMLN